MVKSSVTLNFCLGQHRRQENVLCVKKKILRYRNLEACCVIRPNGFEIYYVVKISVVKYLCDITHLLASSLSHLPLLCKSEHVDAKPRDDPTNKLPAV